MSRIALQKSTQRLCRAISNLLPDDMSAYSAPSLFIGILRADKINEPKSALQKPSTVKPGVKCPASINKSALITRLKRPSVTRFIGRVMRYTSGFKIALMSPIITTAINADWSPVMLIPGISHAINRITREYKNHLKSVYSILPRPFFQLYFFRFFYNFNCLKV